jgi:hypothetical protein
MCITKPCHHIANAQKVENTKRRGKKKKEEEGKGEKEAKETL